jgi:hypothetical protein
MAQEKIVIDRWTVASSCLAVVERHALRVVSDVCRVDLVEDGKQIAATPPRLHERVAVPDGCFGRVIGFYKRDP